MDIGVINVHINTLLNFLDATVKQCIQKAKDVFLILRLLIAAVNYFSCEQSSREFHQSRSVLLRGLSIVEELNCLLIKDESLVSGPKRKLKKLQLSIFIASR
ncbi:hypothetical protein ACQ4N7_29030 [Nodosilinea sp. AN01ver1]|uniref:hypothetical protein n=1 Tax=Nodosilinea sp. AN01ver1 TaxID=3423362 RepID=UPI003D311253